MREQRGTRAAHWRAPAIAVVVALITATAGAAVLRSHSAVAAPTVSVPETCATTGEVTQSGTAIVSGPMVGALSGSSLEVPLEVSVTTNDQVQAGGVVTTVASVRFDLGAQAHQVLVDRVWPAVAAAGYPQLAPSSWVVLGLDASSLDLPLPAGASPLGQPVSTSPTVGTAATWVPGGVRLSLGALTADTRLGASSPVTATVGWQETDGGAPAPRSLDLPAPTMSFTTTVSVGVMFSGSPLVGTVHAGWQCDPPAGGGPIATTAVTADAPASSTPPTLPPSGPPPDTAPPTTAPASSWPERATQPADCAVTGFDRYGGWTGRQLDATGFFRVQQVDGTWWFVDPEGHPFFSQGVNHVTFEGTPDRNGVAAYKDSVTARYGTADAWAAAQVQRFQGWGYNTAGGWSDATITSRMPSVLLVGLTPQDFSTGVMTDLFDPAWVNQVKATAAQVGAEHRDDPQLIGYWTDNELHFGPDWRPSHLFDDYLDRAADAPGKQALLSFLKARYPTFEAFAADFTTSATSWDELAAPSTVTTWSPTGGQATRNDWTGVVAEQYFSVTVGSLRAADPNHLQFGPRFIAQTTGTPVLGAASRWVDVASFNDYAIDPQLLPGLRNADPTFLPTDGALAAQEQVVQKPILISEWGFRAKDSGLPNSWPPLFPVLGTQDERAGAYQQFVSGLLATPWVVGQHFFEHADEPAAGRFDGEDSNFGLVDKNDDPYQPVVQVSRWMHDCAYARLVPQAPPTTAPPTSAPTTAPVTTSPSSTAPESTAPTTGAPQVGDTPAPVGSDAAATDPVASTTTASEPAVAVPAEAQFTG